MRLLFAEDDRDLSAAVKTLLERNGYLVDAVYDGEEAVSYAEAENYDGIVMDWMENGMENDIHETIHRFLKLNGGMVEEALNRSEN